VKPHYIGEQVREDPLGVAQDRALRLDTSQLLEVSEKDDLGVHKSLEGCVASSTGVEQRVSVVHEPPRDKEQQQRGRAEATSASGTVQVRLLRGTSDCAIRCPAGVAGRIRVRSGSSRLAFHDQHIGATGDETRLQNPDYDVGADDRYDVEKKRRAKTSPIGLEKVSPFRGCATSPVVQSSLLRGRA
jgi:hypothetical protein